jgi:hypothetical protein
MIDRSFLPYDGANVFFLDSFLDNDTFNETLKVYKTCEKEQIKSKQLNVSYFGNSIEILNEKYNFDRKLLNENYKKESQLSNGITRSKFEFLFENIKDKLTETFDIPCVYHDQMLRPYIRTWTPNELGVKNDSIWGYHYDCNILFINYERLFSIKPINVISLTIMLETPEYTEFDYLPDTKTNDRNVYFDFNLNTTHYSKSPIEERKKKLEPFIKNKITHRYNLNDVALQWNFTLHRIGKMEFSNENQKRTTIQISGIHDGEKIWLTS